MYSVFNRIYHRKPIELFNLGVYVVLRVLTPGYRFSGYTKYLQVRHTCFAKSSGLREADSDYSRGSRMTDGDIGCYIKTSEIAAIARYSA